MELFDLLDELEALILQGKKPLIGDGKKIFLNKQELLDVVDVIRKMLHEKYQALTQQLNDNTQIQKHEPSLYKNKRLDTEYAHDSEAREIIRNAKQEAASIKREIDGYSDNVLKNLKLTVTKFKGKLFGLSP